MKKYCKRLVLFAAFAAALLLITACTKPDTVESTAEESYTSPIFKVTYQNEFGILNTAEIPMRQVNEYTTEGITKDGRDYRFLRWAIEVDADAQTAVATAVYTTVLDRTETAVNAKELYAYSNRYFDPEQVNEVLVVFVSFTDGHQIDRAAFEDTFIGEYGGEDVMRSVSAYYKANSYGRELLHFNFIYYDCDMTSAKAWHYVNDEDKNGNFLGNKFFDDIFDELRASKKYDFTKFDGDGDGIVDLSLFIFGEDTSKTPDNCFIYGGASGEKGRKADKKNPDMGQYVKVAYESISNELIGGQTQTGIRTLLHEIGHSFGISDYYDFYTYNGEIISTLGTFDMHEGEYGDLNPYSKFTLGWLHPYILTDDIEEVTLELRCSSTYDDAILIPTSKGWNGTAFDEYLLIDVMAPQGANGFDWSWAMDYDIIYEGPAHKAGGVRIYHVDSRMVTVGYDRNNNIVYKPLDSVTKEIGKKYKTTIRFYNTNGVDPKIKGDSRFYHLVEIVPRDGSSKYRITTPTYCSAYTIFTTKDLYGAGDVFDPTQELGCFTNGSKMNNGGVIDYSIRVDAYDEENGIATLTITRLHREDQ